jgi:SAM-dependent methyltransferase
MTTTPVDYDQIASGYDRRFTTDAPSGEGQALRNLARTLKPARILEVGCGTGHWLGELAPVAHTLVGLDLSKGMLRQAKTKQVPADFVQSTAKQLPFIDSVFDLVFCVHAIHHFTDSQAFVSETCRVIRSGGCLAVMGGNPHNWRESWYVYRYFEGVYGTDLLRFPTWDTVSEWMDAVGFKDLELAEVEHIVGHKRGREVLSDPFLQKQACSQLALLTDEAYADGLLRIKEDLTRAERRGETLTFETELTIEMLSGRKA